MTVRKSLSFFFKYLFILLQFKSARVGERGIGFSLLKIPGHRRDADERIGNRTVLNKLSLLKTVVSNPVNAVEITMETIKSQFKAYILQDHQASGYSGDEPDDIDGGKNPCFSTCCGWRS